MFLGALVLRDFVIGGLMHLGDFVLWDFVQKCFCPRGLCPRGFCHRGFCPRFLNDTPLSLFGQYMKSIRNKTPSI